MNHCNNIAVSVQEKILFEDSGHLGGSALPKAPEITVYLCCFYSPAVQTKYLMNALRGDKK